MDTPKAEATERYPLIPGQLVYATVYWARWAKWRDRLRNTTFNHGADLVEELGSPLGAKSGLPDNVHCADTILRELEDRGLITREKFTPSISQRAWHGVSGSHVQHLESYPRAFGWSSVPGTQEGWKALEPRTVHKLDTGEQSVVTSVTDMAYVFRDSSPSSIVAFARCPRMWGYERIDGIRRPEGPSTGLGTAAHAALESWFKAGVHPATVESPAQYPEAGVIAESGLHLWPAPGSVAFDIEKDINATLDGFTFVGTQDLGYWEPEAAGVESLYVVGDHKTTSDFKWAKSPDDLQRDPQALIYSLAAMQRHGVESVKGQWGYLLTKPGRRKAKAVTTVFHRIDVEAAIREHVIPIARLIKAARDEGAESKDLPQHPNACAAFGGCYFQSKCALTPMDRMRAAMEQESLAAKAKRIKAAQAKAAGDADKVEAIEAETTTGGGAAGGINPPERGAPGSLVAKLQGMTGKAPSGPAGATEAPAPPVVASTPSAAPEGGKESIADKIKRMAAAKTASAVEVATPAVETLKTTAPAPVVKVAVTVDATEVVSRKVERVSRVEVGDTVADTPTGLPFVLCVGCAPIGDCTSAHSRLDLIHREFCEANDVSDFRQLPFNRNGEFAAFFAERFDACGFVGFVFVDPRVEFVRACIPVMERRAHTVIRALAF